MYLTDAGNGTQLDCYTNVSPIVTSELVPLVRGHAGPEAECTYPPIRAVVGRTENTAG